MEVINTLNLTENNNKGLTNLSQYVSKSIKKRTYLRLHFVAFTMINLLLIFINLQYTTPDSGYYWWPWVTTGWSIGLACHFYIYVNMDQIKLIKVHTFIYIYINLYLLFIDWYANRIISWCWIVSISWGCGLLFHLILQKEKNSIVESLKNNTTPLIHGLIISENISGRIIIEILDDEVYQKLGMNKNSADVDLLGAFLNALQLFSSQINMNKITDEMNIITKDMNFITLKKENLTIMGFSQADAKRWQLKPIFSQILNEILEKCEKEILQFSTTGNATIFSEYESLLSERIRSPAEIMLK